MWGILGPLGFPRTAGDGVLWERVPQAVEGTLYCEGFLSHRRGVVVHGQFVGPTYLYFSLPTGGELIYSDPWIASSRYTA